MRGNPRIHSTINQLKSTYRLYLASRRLTNPAPGCIQARAILLFPLFSKYRDKYIRLQAQETTARI